MLRFVDVLLILATVHVTKCFVRFDGFHHYDKYHMQQLLKLVRNTCSDAQRELRLIFDNNTLTKQEINDTINDWVRKQSETLVDTIVESLNELQQQMIQMQRTIKESMNISLQEKEALIAILKMKANMSLTNSQEKKEMEQFIKSLNNTDHIKLNMHLRENFLKQQRSPRSILESNESDQILNECELLFSCKLCCHSMNDYNTESDFRGKMKNCTNGDGTIVVGDVIELFESDSAKYAPTLG